MAKRGQYATKQQVCVREFMDAHEHMALTIDEISSGLSEAGHAIGRATLYRALERMTADGLCIQVPDSDLGLTRYCRIADREGSALVCLSCHKAIPISCQGFTDFKEHIAEDHGFLLVPQRTVLFGMCQACCGKDKGLTKAGKVSVDEACPEECGCHDQDGQKN